MLKPVVAIALAAAAALTLSSCTGADSSDGGPGGSDTSGDPLKVVATTTQLADFTAQVGGDDIELTGLLAAGGSAHYFDPTPADLLALGTADVLVVNGVGLDEFVDSAIEASGFDGTVIDASAGIDLGKAAAITLEAGGEGAVHAHDQDDADHDHEYAEDEHNDHAHDHGDLNPHIWTSPHFAQGMVEEIGRGLAESDSVNAEGYTQRAQEMSDRLGVLDAWVASQFERVPAEQRVLVTGHDSLRYYLHDYDIAFAGSLLPSFEDNAEPSAAEIDALVQAIKGSGVKAIFVESSLSPKLAQTVAAEAGVSVVDAESIFADSLGPAGSEAETYIDATVHNTRVILEAWGQTPDPLPSELGA